MVWDDGNVVARFMEAARCSWFDPQTVTERHYRENPTPAETGSTSPSLYETRGE